MSPTSFAARSANLLGPRGSGDRSAHESTAHRTERARRSESSNRRRDRWCGRYLSRRARSRSLGQVSHHHASCPAQLEHVIQNVIVTPHAISPPTPHRGFGCRPTQRLVHRWDLASKGTMTATRSGDWSWSVGRRNAFGPGIDEPATVAPTSPPKGHFAHRVSLLHRAQIGRLNRLLGTRPPISLRPVCRFGGPIPLLSCANAPIQTLKRNENACFRLPLAVVARARKPGLTCENVPLRSLVMIGTDWP